MGNLGYFSKSDNAFVLRHCADLENVPSKPSAASGKIRVKFWVNIRVLVLQKYSLLYSPKLSGVNVLWAG